MLIKDDGTGNPILDENGQNQFLTYVFEMVKDPESGEIMVDDNGDPLWAPIPTFGSEIRYFNADIIVDTTLFDNEREANIALAQQLTNTPAGQYMLQFYPDLYFKVSGELARGIKTTAANKVSQAFLETSNRIAQQAQAQPQSQDNNNA